MEGKEASREPIVDTLSIWVTKNIYWCDCESVSEGRSNVYRIQ